MSVIFESQKQTEDQLFVVMELYSIIIYLYSIFILKLVLRNLQLKGHRREELKDNCGG